MSRRRLAIVLVLLALAVSTFAFGPMIVERLCNGVRERGPYATGEKARALHARIPVADLHADSLLWGRDILQRSSIGQVDVPRLIEGNVLVQGFFLVTQTPRGLNIHANDPDRLDTTTALALLQRWPVATWTSRKARALYQAGRLADAAARSNGALTLIRDRASFARYLERRAREPRITAAVLGVEGAHCLDGEVSALGELFDAGVRVIAPTHFFDNFLGGSSSGLQKPGLTDAGRAFVKAVEERRMIVDLAHASPATIRDVAAMARRPVLVSHTGVRATCDNPRNLSDEEIRAIARTGGVIGLAMFSTATCGEDVPATIRAIQHVIKLVGVDHAALGSDFDGGVTTPTDVSGLARITEALLSAGLSEADVEKVMGGNVVRLLREHLP